jgi:biopolymer transport protein ExbD
MSMRIKLDDDDSVEVQMAPLIDCMFLLLIFFLVATTLKKIVREIPVELPYAEAAVETAEEPDVLVIGLDREGQMYLNGTQANRDLVMAELQVAGTSGQRVRLDADRLIPYESVLEIIEWCHVRGVMDVGLHTLDPRSIR